VLARERPGGDGRPPAISEILAFSGSQPIVESPACVVAVNTLNEHPLLGRVGLVDSHRPVYPLRFGAPDGLDDWSVADWCDQCHRKRGLVTWPDLPRLSPGNPQGEALAALLLGKIDAFEVADLPAGNPWGRLEPWYRLLSCGFRPVLVGASGKESNRVPLGRVRTYARIPLPLPFSLASWNEAVRHGRTFLTSAPLLFLDVNGRQPGDILDAEVGQRLPVRVNVAGVAPLEGVEILVNGEVLASSGPVTPDRLRSREPLIDAEVDLRESAWIAARCWGKEALPEGVSAAAHTSAVFVRVAERPVRPSPTTLAPLFAVLDETSAWVREQARCGSDRQREHLLGVLQSAREELVRRQG
jgi:hypothetical protein